MASGHGHIACGYWPALVIGLAELLILVMSAIPAVRRQRRLRRQGSTLASVVHGSAKAPGKADGPPRAGWGLIAEAMIARERMSVHIDAAAYQVLMGDLISRS